LNQSTNDQPKRQSTATVVVVLPGYNNNNINCRRNGRKSDRKTGSLEYNGRMEKGGVGLFNDLNRGVTLFDQQ